MSMADYLSHSDYQSGYAHSEVSYAQSTKSFSDMPLVVEPRGEEGFDLGNREEQDGIEKPPEIIGETQHLSANPDQFEPAESFKASSSETPRNIARPHQTEYERATRRWSMSARGRGKGGRGGRHGRRGRGASLGNGRSEKRI